MIIRTITPEFTDERGEIRNLPLPFNPRRMEAERYASGDFNEQTKATARAVLKLIGPGDADAKNIALITSKAGSTRSNHWHRFSSHWVYVISGRMLYYERAIGSNDWGTAALVLPGNAVFTMPSVEHRTEFPVDTVFISISDMDQSTEAHEKDVVRVDG